MEDSFEFPDHIMPDLRVTLTMEPRCDDSGARDKLSGYRAPVLFDGFETGSTGWFKFDGGVACRGQKS